MPNSEPESYNIDEMMDRLKNRSSDSSADEGQLVTRADGTKAIRVRKKKRRTEQPQRDRERRIRMIQVAGVLVFLLFIVLSLGCLTIYVNSPPFRKSVVSKIGWATGANVELNQFRMNPSGANAGGVDLKWPGGNVLQSASLRMLHADVSPMSYFGGAIGGAELDAGTATLVLRLPEPGMPATTWPEADGECPVHFDQCGAKKFSLLMQGSKGVALGLSESEAMFVSPKQDNPAQLILSKGNLNITGWSKLQLDRAHIEFLDDKIDLVGLRLNYGSDLKGVLELNGVVAPYATRGASVLQLEADAFLLPGIAGEDLGNLFEGRIDAAPDLGPTELSLCFGERPSASLRFAFRGTLSNPFHLKNLPFLYGLTQTSRDEWYVKPEFNDVVSGLIVRSSEHTELSQLELTSKGRLVVKGGLVRDVQGRLSGRLDVGVAHGMIKASENRVLDKMFSPPKESYRWIQLEIGGTVKTPTDNFSQQYEAALAKLKEEPILNSDVEAPKGFEELTRPR